LDFFAGAACTYRSIAARAVHFAATALAADAELPAPSLAGVTAAVPAGRHGVVRDVGALRGRRRSPGSADDGTGRLRFPPLVIG
jgi:hypothetical protein